MSNSFSCKCPERKRPVDERDWIVSQYCCNHSAFNGYHRTRSDYSTVACRRCGAVGRTKGEFVVSLIYWQNHVESTVVAGQYRTIRDTDGAALNDPLAERLQREASEAKRVRKSDNPEYLERALRKTNAGED